MRPDWANSSSPLRFRYLTTETIALTPLERRLALLHKGPHAFPLVLGGKEHAE
jgi:hypothetical protein